MVLLQYGKRVNFEVPASRFQVPLTVFVASAPAPASALAPANRG